MDAMRLVKSLFRLDNPKYWQLFLRSTDDIGEWEFWRQYEAKCVQLVEKFINV